MTGTSRKLANEIYTVVSPKLFNVQNNTASEIEKQILKECLGFLSLIKYSSLPTRKIKEIWEYSDLRYR